MLTKKQRLRSVYERIIYFLGGYRSYGRVSKNLDVSRLVFVCSGNICRSVLAEYYANKIGMNAVSFGVDAPDGDPANRTMEAVAKNNNLYLDGHLTTSMESYTYQPGDLIVGVDIKHLNMIAKSKGLKKESMLLMGLFLDAKKVTLIDPYGKDVIFFENTADNIYEAVERIVDVVR